MLRAIPPEIREISQRSIFREPAIVGRTCVMQDDQMGGGHGRSRVATERMCIAWVDSPSATNRCLSVCIEIEARTAVQPEIMAVPERVFGAPARADLVIKQSYMPSRRRQVLAQCLAIGRIKQLIRIEMNEPFHTFLHA